VTGVAASAVGAGRLNRKRQKLLEAPVSVATFKAMDANGDGTMSETEFVVARLITMKMLGSEVRASWGI